MNVSINQELCIGCELCTGECAATFAMGEDGKAHVQQQPANTLPEEDCVLSAAAHCPTEAIVVQ